jgi:hypothetical protein
MASQTNIQLFGLCVQMLVENNQRDRSVWTGIMSNHDACISFIHNYFFSGHLNHDAAARADLRTKLLAYAAESQYINDAYNDFLEEHPELSNHYDMNMYVSVDFLQDNRFALAQASGGNDTFNVQLASICLLRDLLIHLRPAVNPNLSLRNQEPDSSIQLRPWA